jgi:hypothetical protein
MPCGNLTVRVKAIHIYGFSRVCVCAGVCGYVFIRVEIKSAKEIWLWHTLESFRVRVFVIFWHSHTQYFIKVPEPLSKHPAILLSSHSMAAFLACVIFLSLPHSRALSRWHLRQSASRFFLPRSTHTPRSSCSASSVIVTLNCV